MIERDVIVVCLPPIASWNRKQGSVNMAHPLTVLANTQYHSRTETREKRVGNKWGISFPSHFSHVYAWERTVCLMGLRLDTSSGAQEQIYERSWLTSSALFQIENLCYQRSQRLRLYAIYVLWDWEFTSSTFTEIENWRHLHSLRLRNE